MKTDHIIITNLHIAVPQMKKDSDLSIDDALNVVTSTAAQMRMNFYDHSVPWKPNGDRLMTTWVFNDFYEIHKAICLKFAKQQKEFIDAYLTAVDQLEFRLVEDFDPTEFPAEKVKFTLIFNLDRVSMPLAPGDETDAPAVVTVFPEQLEQRFADAEKLLREKLRKPMENFIEGFSKPKNFYASQLDGLTRMANIVRRLNFSEDTSLKEVCDMVDAGVGKSSIKVLRESEEARGAAVAAVKRALHNLD